MHSPDLPLQETGEDLRVSGILSALSFALDLTEGQPAGHAVRCCVLGMRIARQIGMPQQDQADLYYALLAKDAGCSSNASRMFHILGTDDIAAKRDVKTTDWTKVGWDSLEYALSHIRTGAPFLERVRALVEVAVNHKRDARDLVQIRCERGSAIARQMGLSEKTANAILSLDELWNGTGQPQGLRGAEIPLFSRIMSLAQNLDVFYMTQGTQVAINMAEVRSGKWFDPDLVKAFLAIANDPSLWEDVDRAFERVGSYEPQEQVMVANEETLDSICLAFADVIDAKSPFTFRHSAGVARAATAIAQTMGMTSAEVRTIRRAALLHDIGKLSVSNSILEKPGKLDNAEWDVMKKHAYYSYEILRRTPGFQKFALMAASHHEKLDGSGYFRGVEGHQIPLGARVLVVADMFDALHAKRPYRDALPAETVLAIIEKETPRAVDPECLEALRSSSGEAHEFSGDLLRLSEQVPKSVAPEPTIATAEMTRRA